MLIFNKNKILKLFIIIFVFFALTATTALAQPTSGTYGGEVQPPTNPFSPDKVLTGKSKAKDDNTTYTLLAPFGERLKVFNVKSECAFTDYMNIIFDLFIGICAVLAFLMLVIGGIQYMGSELISSKEAAKSQVTNALLGLLVAFSAWMILNTINPKLLDFCLSKNLPTVKFTISEDIGDEATTYDGKNIVQYETYKEWAANNACPGQTGKESETCIKLETTTLPKKYPNKSLEKDTLLKMQDFDNRMKSVGIVWYITEAFPPTSVHRSRCHNNGTCLDLNITDPTPEKIKKVIDGLMSLGMCTNYEVVSGGITRESLNSVGIPNTRIWNSRGTAAHFHAVNGGCK